MNRRGLLCRLARRRGVDPEAGITLVEVLASMSVMSIVMAMFTTGVVQMHRSVAIQEAVTLAQSQINIAFQRLDKEVRYASGISVPGQAPNGVPYVEYAAEAGGVLTCVQLRLIREMLQLRTWDPMTGPPTDNWKALVSRVAAATAPAGQPTPTGQAGPFAFWNADPVRVYQRLRVGLVATAGKDWNRTAKESVIIFAALNTSSSTDGAAVCQAPRPTG